MFCQNLALTDHSLVHKETENELKSISSGAVKSFFHEDLRAAWNSLLTSSSSRDRWGPCIIDANKMFAETVQFFKPDTCYSLP